MRTLVDLVTLEQDIWHKLLGDMKKKTFTLGAKMWIQERKLLFNFFLQNFIILICALSEPYIRIFFLARRHFICLSPGRADSVPQTVGHLLIKRALSIVKKMVVSRVKLNV